MDNEKMCKTIDGIIDRHGDKKPIVAILQDIQEEYRYLPKEALFYLAKKIDVSIAKIYSVAIKICDGTACHVRKSIPILNALQNKLNLTEGKKTTDDGLFTVETVSCLGACGLAPVMTVNDKVYPAMTPESATALVEELE